MSNQTEVIEYGITDVALAELGERLNGVDARQDYALAKTSLKECQQLRKKLTDAHKEKKADALAFGRRLDVEKNRIMNKIVAVEEPIKESKDAVDKEAERKEAARIQAFTNTIDEIESLGEALYDADIGELTDRLARLQEFKIEGFDEYFPKAKATHNRVSEAITGAINAAKLAAVEAEKLEAQRVEQQAEADRLSKIAKDQEAAAKKLRKEQEEIDRKKREELEAIAEAQRQRQEKIDREERELNERKAAEEAEKARLEQEAKDTEERERLERAAAERAEQLKPDKDRLSSLADAIEFINAPDVKSNEAQFVIAETRESLVMVAIELRRRIKELA